MVCGTDRFGREKKPGVGFSFLLRRLAIVVKKKEEKKP
jgi:hypothetical protein